MFVTDVLDGGNAETVALRDDGADLRIRTDRGADFYQWFYFRASDLPDRRVSFRLVNAAGAAYARGWRGYRACYSADGERWQRVATTYEDGVLTIQHRPLAPVGWYAYFAPYPWARHEALIARCQAAPGARVRTLGRTLDGRALDAVQVGPDGQRTVWAIARQHPGETMAQWWMEGFLARLLDPHDAVARRLRQSTTVIAVPNMNPDGSVRGHLRTNAVGANLNREWQTPTAERSPEVLATRAAMDERPPALALDVHGDEVIPHTFIAGPEGIPGWSDDLARQQDVFVRALCASTPDFQTRRGYPIDKPGRANLTMAGKAIAQRYGCLSLTLEMPFKDHADLPDPVHGWSPQRSMRLGAACLDAIAATLP